MFSKVVEKVEDIQIQVHCDSGSLLGTEKGDFRSQTGIVACLASKKGIRELPETPDRVSSNTRAYKAVKNEVFVPAVPIMWRSSKSQRIATSAFGAEIQAVYTAVDIGSVLRVLYSELLYGRPDHKVNVVIRNDNLGVVHKANSICSIPQERRLLATLDSIKEALADGIIDECGWIAGIANVSDGLTKSNTTGDDIEYLFRFNKLNVTTKGELQSKCWDMRAEKQYLANEKKIEEACTF